MKQLVACTCTCTWCPSPSCLFWCWFSDRSISKGANLSQRESSILWDGYFSRLKQQRRWSSEKYRSARKRTNCLYLDIWFRELSWYFEDEFGSVAQFHAKNNKKVLMFISANRNAKKLAKRIKIQLILLIRADLLSEFVVFLSTPLKYQPYKIWWAVGSLGNMLFQTQATHINSQNPIEPHPEAP